MLFNERMIARLIFTIVCEKFAKVCEKCNAFVNFDLTFEGV